MTVVTAFGPDFPFAYDDWLRHPAGLGQVPEARHGTEVAVVGAGMAGMVAAHELLKLGLRPVVYESRRIGGRLHSEPFKGADGVIAELGAMRFPRSSTAFWHYLDALNLATQPFPNPLSPGAPSTVIDLAGETLYAKKQADLPSLFSEVEAAWQQALEEHASFSAMRAAIVARDVDAIKRLWNDIVWRLDASSFYGFLAESRAFSERSFRHREVFGQVGFGTGGWDTDFPNTILEILRVVFTASDDDQHLVVGGVEQVPRGLWSAPVHDVPHWPDGTSLASLHSGAPRAGVAKLSRVHENLIEVTDQWGVKRRYHAALVTCQGWLLTTHIDCDESLFAHDVWMAIDRTRYMQSAKTFVMVDRPFWKDKDPRTGRDVMSMTLTDRLTRGTYLFDLGPGKPGVICLSYAWMTDALKMLPLPVERRVNLALDSLAKIYPNVDIRSHIIGDPLTVSWEADPNFLGAFKGALPGDYRYNRRMFCHFMQDHMPAHERGIFLAGDDIGFMPGWVEGAVQTSLNAVWGVVHHLGGSTNADNPGPGDLFEALQPVVLAD